MTQREEAGVDREPDIWEYLAVLRRRWPVLAAVWLVTVLATGLLSWLSPKIYEAVTSIYVPPSSDIGALLLPLGGGARGGGGSGAGAGSGGDAPNIGALLSGGGGSGMQFNKTVLMSRRTLTRLIADLHLQDKYGIASMEQLIRILRSDTQIIVGRDGTLTLAVQAVSPQLAADIANHYVDLLRDFQQHQVRTNPAKQLDFVEDQLKNRKAQLSKLEHDLARFESSQFILSNQDVAEQVTKRLAGLDQQRSMVELLIEQTRLSLAGGGVISQSASTGDAASGGAPGDSDVAYLNRKLVEKSSNLAVLQRSLGPDHPQVERAEREVQALQQQLKGQIGKSLAALEQQRAAIQTQIKRVEQSVANLPPQLLEFTRLTRDLKVQEALYLYLSQERERALIAKAKDQPDFDVLDKAVPPEFKLKPQTMKNVAVAVVVGLVLGVLAAFSWDFFAAVGMRRRSLR